MRRAYVAQYSPEVIVREPGVALHRCEPVLRDGVYVGNERSVKLEATLTV